MPSPNDWPDIHVIDSDDKFDAAIEAFRKRIPITKEEWLALDAFERENAFTVANVTNGRVLQDVCDSIDQAVELGTDFEQFKDEVGLSLIEEWGGEIPGRLETIFRTNLMTTYSEGRHAIYSSPTVKRERPYLRCDGVEDDRECDICEAFDGVIRPQDEWKTKTPPFHFNAIAGSTKIITEKGEIPVSSVHPGMLVATHAGKWRIVMAVMRKAGGKVKELHLASGRVLRATDEHPILIAAPMGGLIWKRCVDLKVGDQVLEHCQQMSGSQCGVAIHTHDAPSLGDKPGVADMIMGLAGGRTVNLPVDLKIDSFRHEGQIHDVLAKTKLRNDSGPEDASEQCLTRCEFLAPHIGERGAGALPYAWDLHRVVIDHADGSVLELEPPSPVVLAATFGNGRGVGSGDAGPFDLAPDRDAMLRAPLGNQSIGQPKSALDVADASASPEVLLADDGLQFLPGMEECGLVGHVHATTVSTIVDTATDEDLFDLSVQLDETYFADGVLVHNCRHQLTPLSAEEAEAEGIHDTMPNQQIDGDFGHAPSKDGDDWDFNLANMPSEVKVQVQQAIETGEK